MALGSVETLSELLAPRRAHLLLCNILAPVIEALFPGFEGLLQPDWRALLSGLLVDQAPRLKEVLGGLGLDGHRRGGTGPLGAAGDPPPLALAP